MKKTRIKIGPEINDRTRSVLIDKEDGLFVGTITTARDGQPIQDGQELVQIDRACQDGWHDAETLYTYGEDTSVDSGNAASVLPTSGPAQVATPAYRAGYDRIFGKKTAVGVA